MERWLNLSAEGARRVVTLEREFRTDPADLWQAITDPVRAARWLASLTIDGDDVALGFHGGAGRTGKIVECEAPHRLRLVLEPGLVDESHLVVTLEPTNAGTKLVMQQDGLPPIRAALFAGGWQHHAERLDAALGGSAPQTPLPELVPPYREAEAASVAGWITKTDDGTQVELERVIGARAPRCGMRSPTPRASAPGGGRSSNGRMTRPGRAACAPATVSHWATTTCRSRSASRSPTSITNEN